DNVLFNNWAYGFHSWAPSGYEGELTNLHFEGNIAFDNGSISYPTNAGAELLVGSVPAKGLRVTDNRFYEAPAFGGWAGRIGAYSTTNDDAVITGNTFVKLFEMGPWTTATVSGNIFYSDGWVLSTTGSLAGFTWTGNVHYRDPSAAAWGTSDIGSFASL